MDYIRIQVDPEMKKASQALFDDMGLNLSQGIKMLLKQCINHGGIPFEIKAKHPNPETVAAMLEIEQGKGQSFRNAKELFASWDD
jgi:DNA-damage-inducible protein J